MRSYALLILALAVLHARAASISSPEENEKKLPIGNDGLDDVSLDNNDSEQELIDQSNAVKDVENNLRKSAPVETVPVKIIEEQPVIKTIALKEDSNDYVPDNDDSTNIKRLEIDLNNPGPPQRQEHDSQNPAFYVDNERAVTEIKQFIEESENTFKHGIHDVRLNLESYLATNEGLSVVQQNVKNLKLNVNAEVSKLGEKINSYLKPESVEDLQKVPVIEEVVNKLKTLENKFNAGVDMLSEGVELLSILKEENDQMDKISGKADNENLAGTGPVSPGPSSPAPVLPIEGTNWFQSFQTSVSDAFYGLTNSIQNAFSPSQNQNQGSAPNQSGFNPGNIFQNLNFPNFFQGQNPAQSQNPQPQGVAPAGAQSDEVATTLKPNIIQQIQSGLQNILNPGQNNQQQQPQQQQQNQNPIVQAIQSFPIVQQISNFIQQRPPNSQPVNQQTSQGNNVVINQNDPNKPSVAPAAEQPSNSVPAVPPQPPQPPQADPPKPAKESQPTETATVQNGPIQQFVQNNPIAQGITHTVQRIQGSITNPSKPRDALVEENADTKGHKPGRPGDNNVTAWSNFINGLIGTINASINSTAASVATAVNSVINTIGANVQVESKGDGNIAASGVDTKSDPAVHIQTGIPEIKNGVKTASEEQTKTE